MMIISLSYIPYSLLFGLNTKRRILPRPIPFKTKKKQFNHMLRKIVLLGDGGVGKSAISIQFTQHHFVLAYNPTIENTYRKQYTLNNLSYILEILDTAGQEEYRVLLDQYIRVGEAFILVCSITSLVSYNELDFFNNKIELVKNPEGDTKIPKILVGNKCDLEEEREVSKEMMAEKGRKYNCPTIEASARKRINIDEVFMNLLNHMEGMKKEDGKGGNTADGGRKWRCLLL